MNVSVSFSLDLLLGLNQHPMIKRWGSATKIADKVHCP